MNYLLNQYRSHPLQMIMVSALVMRLLSAIFSQGYGMHDDHFLIIEVPGSWAHDMDFNSWLPKSQLHPRATGHNLFYPGIHYLLFMVFNYINLQDPQVQMFIIRLLHAIYSLLTVYYGYKITLRLSDARTAAVAGWMLALLWFMPFMSVRNLVEIVAIPILLAGVWILIKHEGNTNLWHYVLSGLVMSIAVSVRYQTFIFIGGVGLALIIRKKLKEAFAFGLGSLISIALIQGTIDMILWGSPFEEMKAYIRYNIQYRYAYGVNNYLMYFEVILGFLIPPFSILLFTGFFRTWKKHLLIFLPVFLFLAFHTYFPNKQERFIFTVIPFIVISGMVGWDEYVAGSAWWQRRSKLSARIFLSFWIINLTILPFVSLSSSKLSRVNAMYSLYPDRNRINTVLLDDSEKKSGVMMPVFYSGKPLNVFTLEKSDVHDTAISGKNTYIRFIHSLDVFTGKPQSMQPQYVLFTEGPKLQERIRFVRRYFPRLVFVKTIMPSNVDRIMKRLNPHNRNEVFYLYKNCP